MNDLLLADHERIQQRSARRLMSIRLAFETCIPGSNVFRTVLHRSRVEKEVNY